MCLSFTCVSILRAVGLIYRAPRPPGRPPTGSLHFLSWGISCLDIFMIVVHKLTQTWGLPTRKRVSRPPVDSGLQCLAQAELGTRWAPHLKRPLWG